MNPKPNYLTENYRDIKVSWLPDLDGGGRTFGQEYVPVVRSLFGKVDRVYEFCSGPAFIGFTLLAEGLCNSLCLSDINPKAVAAVKDTIKRNGLEDRVQIYLSDSLRDVPETEQWDLVVSNPPHFEVETKEEYEGNIRLNDPHWQIHLDFYDNVARYLKPGGSILMQENHQGSDEKTFLGMVAKGGLQFIDSFLCECEKPGILNPFFYFWCQRQGGTLRMNRQEHSRFIFGDPEVLSISTSGKEAPAFALSSRRKYKFQLTNTTSAPVELVMFHKRQLIFWKQALAPILKVPASTTGTSGTYSPGTGSYQVRDGSGNVLATFVVS